MTPVAERPAGRIGQLLLISQKIKERHHWIVLAVIKEDFPSLRIEFLECFGQ